jgi:hypothetical protein
LSSERFKRSTVMEYLWADHARCGGSQRIWDGKCDGPDGPATPHLMAVGLKVNQKRVMTAKTMTSIRIVGTSFIIRYVRPVRVFVPVRNSFRRRPSQ